MNLAIAVSRCKKAALIITLLIISSNLLVLTTNKQKGTGIGLNIIYNLITQKLNGSIKCTSHKDKGVLFTIMQALNK